MIRKQIRTKIRELRRGLSVEFQVKAAQNICFCIEKHCPEIFSKQTYAIYLSSDGELDTSVIIRRLWDLNKDVYLPVVDPKISRAMVFRKYTPQTPMFVDKYGILEPTSESPIITTAELDVIFTPLVAFDEFGNRLGMGGGYYDTTLKQCLNPENNTTVIGLAHDLQKTDKLPTESWDVPLPAIATPSAFYRF